MPDIEFDTTGIREPLRWPKRGIVIANLNNRGILWVFCPFELFSGGLCMDRKKDRMRFYHYVDCLVAAKAEVEKRALHPEVGVDDA